MQALALAWGKGVLQCLMRLRQCLQSGVRANTVSAGSVGLLPARQRGFGVDTAARAVWWAESEFQDQISAAAMWARQVRTRAGRVLTVRAPSQPTDAPGCSAPPCGSMSELQGRSSFPRHARARVWSRRLLLQHTGLRLLFFPCVGRGWVRPMLRKGASRRPRTCL